MHERVLNRLLGLMLKVCALGGSSFNLPWFLNYWIDFASPIRILMQIKQNNISSIRRLKLQENIFLWRNIEVSTEVGRTSCSQSGLLGARQTCQLFERLKWDFIQCLCCRFIILSVNLEVIDVHLHSAQKGAS